jgi:hypothetical protein
LLVAGQFGEMMRKLDAFNSEALNSGALNHVELTTIKN